MKVLEVLIKSYTRQKLRGPHLCESCNFCKTEFYNMALLMTHMEIHFKCLQDKNKPTMFMKGALCTGCERVSAKHRTSCDWSTVFLPGLWKTSNKQEQFEVSYTKKLQS